MSEITLGATGDKVKVQQELVAQAFRRDRKFCESIVELVKSLPGTHVSVEATLAEATDQKSGHATVNFSFWTPQGGS